MKKNLPRWLYHVKQANYMKKNKSKKNIAWKLSVCV